MQLSIFITSDILPIRVSELLTGSNAFLAFTTAAQNGNNMKPDVTEIPNSILQIKLARILKW